MKLYTAALLLTAIPLFAQAPPAKPKDEPPVSRVSHLIPVKHLTGRALLDAVNMIRMFGAGIDSNSALGVIAVSGSPDAVAAVEAAIKALDVPSKGSTPSILNVEVTLYVVAGSNKPGDSKLLPDLEPVIKQMRAIFQYQSYKIVDTQLVRSRINTPSRQGSAEFAGILSDEKGDVYSYGGNFVTSASEDAKGRIYNLDSFAFDCRRKDAPGVPLVRFSTRLDVREGQKAVVGKSNLGTDSAIFLIVSAKQVD